MSARGTSSPGTAPVGCANCGHPQVDHYCSRCGQRMLQAPFTFRALARQAVADLFNLERGLVFTVVSLGRRPGWTVSEYLRGRTRPFTHPAKYLLVSVALAVFTFHFSGLMQAQTEWLAPGTGAGALEADARILDVLNRYLNVLMMLGVPFLALFSRLLFRAAGRNLVEHLVFNTYAYAQQNILLVVTIPLFLLRPDVGLHLVWYPLLATAYYLWACRQFFGVGVVSAIGRGLAVTLGGYLVFSGLGLALGLLVGPGG